MSREHYRSAVEQSPFHPRTASCCLTNEWTRWAGYTTVDCYTEIELEYFAVRNTCTVFDLSPMVKYRINGPDAEAYVNRLVTRNVAKLAPGRVAYVVWCNGRGHVLDDGTLFRLSDNEFRLCCQERHLCWLLDSAYGYDVAVTDASADIAALSVQGPTSCATLKAMGFDGVERLKPFHMGDFAVDGVRAAVSRTGFTGDLGYELWLDPEHALDVWDRLMDSGSQHGIRPIGSRALDLARIEAGFIAPHVDFIPAAEALRSNRGRSPFELGLDWLVDFKKGHFNGRRALLEEQRKGSRHRLVGLDVESNKPASGSLIYHAKSREVGHVTSAMWSPTCKRNLALATVQAQYRHESDNLWTEIYVLKELKWEKLMVRCRVVQRPFFNPARRRATPAGDF